MARRMWINAPFFAVFLSVSLIGCEGDQAEPPPLMRPFEGVHLRLLIVNDAPLAEAVEEIRGEWQARTGGKLTVEPLPDADWQAAAERMADCDAALFPAPWLGTLVEQDLLQPLAAEQLQAEQLAWQDVFYLLRSQEAAWGEDVYGLPLGSPFPLVACHQPQLEALGCEVPRTWAEFDQLHALAVAHKQTDGEPHLTCGTVQPLGPGSAAFTFLARAAAYACHPDNYSTLFDIETMQPLIDGPPFVRALEELSRNVASGPAEQLEWNSAEAFAYLHRGKCAAALIWQPRVDASHAETAAAVRWAELPGSQAKYNVSRDEWETRDAADSGRVTLLGLGGRIGAVTQASQHPEAAFQLLVSLIGNEWGTRLRPASQHTGLARSADREFAAAWQVPQPQAFADLAATTLNREQALYAIRIPGRKRYLAALDDAVRRAVRGELSAQAALDAVADQWRQITAELGEKQQRMAYLRSLGIAR